MDLLFDAMKYRFRALKYLAVLTLPLTVAISFSSTGWWCWLPLIYVFGMLPLLELFIRPSEHNLEEAEEEMVRKDRLYDWLLYAMLPLQFAFVFWFCWQHAAALPDGVSLAGRIVGLGLMCGTMGINVGHELGHRPKAYEQRIAQGLLLSSLYMHFFIEHNRGHHKHVSTPEDPASSRMGEWIFTFWLRSLLGSYFSAWRLEFARMQRLGKARLSFSNQMLQFQLVQLALVAGIGLGFGWEVALYFVGAAFIGALLLETVNYIEHYGLSRSETGKGRYERVMPWHSWNSNHALGRLLLFELSRHSDHHYIASRPYPLLRHFDDAPQMPTGYPGMMLMALIPPLWFAIMNPRVRKVQAVVHG